MWGFKTQGLSGKNLIKKKIWEGVNKFIALKVTFWDNYSIPPSPYLFFPAGEAFLVKQR